MADSDDRRPQAPAFEILIGEDGEVIFPDLDLDMLDVALALDPASELACRRPGAADGAGAGGEGAGGEGASGEGAGGEGGDGGPA